MSLTLVIGPANAAKAGEVLGAYRAALTREPFLVVPTAADVLHYRRELAAEGAVLGGTIGGFGAFVREIARRAGISDQVLGPLGRERLLAGAIADARLRVLADSAQAPGFVDAAGRLVSELQRSLVTAPRFSAALAAWARAGEGREDYAREVAAIYSGYVRRCRGAGRVDEDGLAWRALDAVRAAPRRWGQSPVFLYGFDDLTLLQRDAIETLARVVGVEVTLSLSYEPGRQAFAGRAGTVEELRPLAARVLELPARAEHYAPASRAALHHLERGLFEDSPRRVPAGDAVRLLEAGGERAELELIAAEVLGLLERGLGPERIAVVLRSPSRAASLVEQVFGAYGIPYVLPRTIALGHTALGRGLLALGRCALAGDAVAAAELLTYLRTPGRLQRPELADALELAVRREGIADAAGARARFESDAGWRLDEIDRLREAATRGTAALARELGARASRLFAAPHRGSGQVLSATERIDADALRTLHAALAEVAELDGEGSASALLDSLARLEVRVDGAAARDAVLVAEPLAVRARRFDAVIVAGLQEGEFPRPARPEPFLGDEQRRELARAAGLRLPAREDGLADERYLFYACVSRARERVVLSYRTSDEEGGPASPSFFVSDVAVLLDKGLWGRRACRPLSQVTWSAQAAPTTAERARALAAAGPRVEEPRIGDLDAAATARLRHRDILSAGALESYADCPVRWFVERELQPEALEPDPEAIVRGQFIHSVLERTLRRLAEQRGSARLTPSSLADAERILLEAIEAERPRHRLATTDAGARAAVRRVQRDLLRHLRREASVAVPWEPVELELAFGFDGEDSLPALELGGGELRVRGAIDRVDVDPVSGGAIVFDYKSGRKRPDWPVARWASDRRLQVALYMLAVRVRLGRDAVAGAYVPLGGDESRPRGVALVEIAERAPNVFMSTDLRERDELDAELRAAEGRAVTLATELHAGRLEPCPRTCRPRGGCAYPGICRSASG